jgi:exodeoxyribonuclease VII small subunit
MQGGRGGVAVKEEETSLEEALDDLEQIVELLEEGKMSLEESLELYEKGMKLAGLCQSRLESAEKRIECLTGELPPDLI